MMYKKQVMDERIILERYKILGIAGAVFSIGILFDVLYKALFLKASINSFIVELITFLLAGTIYLILGIWKSVLFQMNNKSDKVIFKFKAFWSSLLLGLLFLVSDLFTKDDFVIIKNHLGWTLLAFISIVLISWIIDVFLMKLANRE
ncbi:DUF6773 family protein [Gottfriedia sp. S16(2024)]|uniref:DUF6773 family protein n=1 Tax=Gottfriedia sp. S16(2024) TaxID=3162883 RepID=UPI003D201097